MLCTRQSRESRDVNKCKLFPDSFKWNKSQNQPELNYQLTNRDDHDKNERLDFAADKDKKE